MVLHLDDGGEHRGHVLCKDALQGDKNCYHHHCVDFEQLVEALCAFNVSSSDLLPNESRGSLLDAKGWLVVNSMRVHNYDLSRLSLNAEVSRQQAHKMIVTAIEQRHDHARHAELEVLAHVLKHIRPGCDHSRSHVIELVCVSDV